MLQQHRALGVGLVHDDTSSEQSLVGATLVVSTRTCGQVGSTVEREQPDRLLAAMLDDGANAVGIDHVDVQGILDGRGQLGQRELLQQPQHADVRPRAVPRVGGFQSPPQQAEAVGQCPMLQRSGIVDARWLAFQQGQVVDRLEKRPLPLQQRGCRATSRSSCTSRTSSTVATTINGRWA